MFKKPSAKRKLLTSFPPTFAVYPASFFNFPTSFPRFLLAFSPKVQGIITIFIRTLGNNIRAKLSFSNRLILNPLHP